MFVQMFVHGPQSWATEERQVLEVEPGLNPPNFLHTLRKMWRFNPAFLGGCIEITMGEKSVPICDVEKYEGDKTYVSKGGK